jgi:hypothetical protein
VTSSGVESVTVKIAWPLELVVLFTAVIVEWPLPCASVTVLPLTGVLFVSSRVTVIVDVPLVVTVVGLALTVELLFVGVPAIAVEGWDPVKVRVLPELPVLLYTFDPHVMVRGVPAVLAVALKVTVMVVGLLEEAVPPVTLTFCPETLAVQLLSFETVTPADPILV